MDPEGEEPMAENVKVPNENPNLAGKDQMRDERAKSYVIQEVARVSGARAELETRWVVEDRLWRGDPISRYYPLDYSTSIPEAYKQVETAAARVTLATMPGDEWFRLIPKRKGAIEPRGAKALMQEQYKDGRLAQRWYSLVQQNAKYGFCVAKIPWRYDRQKVRVREQREELAFDGTGKNDGMKTVTQNEEQEINRDRTELRPLSIFDYVVDWRYDNRREAPWEADYCKQTREYCLDMLETTLEGTKTTVYANITVDEIRMLGVQPPPPELAGKDLQQQASGASVIPKKEENEITVLDWWGLFDIDGEGVRENCHIIILNGTHVVHISRPNLWHGQRPYLGCSWARVEGELYGMGVVEPIARLIMDINDNQNNINAGSALSVNPMVKAGDKFNIPDDQFQAIPGRVLRGEDISQLQPFVLPDTTNVARQNKSEFKQEIEETTGILRSSSGGEPEEETATQYTGRRRDANIRLRPVILQMVQEILQPFVEMCLFNNQQFLDEERTVQYEGRAGQYFRYQVTPEDLAGIARVQVELAPQIELFGVRGQMMISFMQILAQLGPLAAQEPFRSMTKRAYINQFGADDAGEIWPEDDMNLNDSQQEELLVMLKGQVVDVKPTDNHVAHMQYLGSYMASKAFNRVSAKIRAIVNAHYATHEMYFRQGEEQAGPLPGPEELATAAMGGAGVNVPAPTMEQLGEQLEGVTQGRPLAEEQRLGIQGR